MKTLLAAALILALVGCACIPKAMEQDDLKIGMSYQAVKELDSQPIREIHTVEIGHIVKELHYIGGTVLTFKDDALIRIERRL